MVYRLPVLLSSMLLVASSTAVLARAISFEVNFVLLLCLGSKEPTVMIIFESLAGICFQRLERMVVRATSVISSRSTMLSKTSSGNLLSLSTSLSYILFGNKSESITYRDRCNFNIFHRQKIKYILSHRKTQI